MKKILVIDTVSGKINLLHEYILLENTGCRQNLADNLGITVSMLRDYVRQCNDSLEKFEVEIIFSRARNTYYYSRKCLVHVAWVVTCEFVD